MSRAELSQVRTERANKLRIFRLAYKGLEVKITWVPCGRISFSGPSLDAKDSRFAAGIDGSLSLSRKQAESQRGTGTDLMQQPGYA